MKRGSKLFAATLASFAVLALAASFSPSQALPNTTTGTKSAKQCDAELRACKSKCDQTIIDVGNAVNDCKNRCTDVWATCTLQESAMPKTNKPTTIGH